MDTIHADVRDSRKVEKKDNMVSMPLMDGDEVSIAVNGQILAQFVTPDNKEMKIYLSSIKRTVQWK
jgi:hypothetical protein